MCGGRKHHLGRFDTAKKAAIAYNRKAVKLFGEYAFLNARCRYTPSPAFACGQAV